MMEGKTNNEFLFYEKGYDPSGHLYFTTYYDNPQNPIGSSEEDYIAFEIVFPQIHGAPLVFNHKTIAKVWELGLIPKLWNPFLDISQAATMEEYEAAFDKVVNDENAKIFLTGIDPIDSSQP